MPPNNDVDSVLARFGLVASSMNVSVKSLGNAGGWSGSRLWRVEVADGTFHGSALSRVKAESRPVAGIGIPLPVLKERAWCLRRWPQEHPTKQTLRFIHPVIRRIASSLPVCAYPLKTSDGSTYVDHAGHLWEATEWRPGKADYHANPNRKRLAAAMQVLARFHELAALQSSPPELPMAVFRRWQLARELHDGGVATIQKAMQDHLGNDLDTNGIDTLARRLLVLSRRALRDVRALLERSISEPAMLPRGPAFPVIRDIHHDHVLFTDDEVTGLIDFGAMQIDTPLTDIARLVGSLVGDDREARQFAFDAYSELRPLTELDRRVIDLLDETAVVLGGLNWLKWLYVERRDMGPTEPIVRRLDEIIQRLERFAPP